MFEGAGKTLDENSFIDNKLSNLKDVEEKRTNLVIKNNILSYDVKIERESDDEVEIDKLYPDHVIKEEMVIGPVVLQRVAYPKDTSVCRLPKSETQLIKTEDVDSQETTKHNIDEVTQKFDLNRNNRNKIDSYCNEQTETSITKCNNTVKYENVTKDIYFKCEKCMYKTATQDSYMRHMKLHDKNRNFICDICGYRYKDKRKIQTHLKNVHSLERIYECDTCEYGTNSAFHLIRHLKVHSGEKLFSCSSCDYKSSRRCDLKVHMRCHTDEKPYFCSVCNFKCNRKTNLLTHLMTHTGEKPFACSLCSYKTARQYDLSKHIRIHHTGEKPYTCSICTYRAARKDQLTSHFKNNHA